MKCPDCAAENIAGADECAGCGHALQDPAPRAPDGDLTLRLRQGTIADLMPRPAVAVAPDLPVAEAVKLMREEKVGCVLVARGGRVIGIMTERDVLYQVAGARDPRAVNVVDVMHLDPDFLRADEPVSHAFHHMAVGGYRHMPVRLDDGAVAIVSSRDLLAYLSPAE